MAWDKMKTGIFAADEQTGKVFELETEDPWDVATAIISVVYLIAMLSVFAWQFIDIATGRMALLQRILGDSAENLNGDTYRAIAYAIIGGGLGGTVNGFRSILVWHAERRAFGWRHLWKYVTLPLLGATLAAMVYALTRAGIGVVGGYPAPGSDSAIQAFSAFAIGAVSGYGSQNACKWLDQRVNTMFKISETAVVKVPELKGRTEKEARDTLQRAQLNVGTISQQPDPANAGNVISQSPPAGDEVAKSSPVDITLGK